MNKITKKKNTSIDLWSNCLSIVRIVAAVQVMLGHMTEHLELPINDALLHTLYFLRGVPLFFGISGFLIWFSIGRSGSYGQYLVKRFWRIYPELWVAVLVEIVPLIIFCGSPLNIRDMLLFALGQGTILQFWTPDSLRCYGVGTPNGALWTIGVMIQFYVIAWFFFKAMKGRSLKTWLVGFVVSFGLSFVLGLVAHGFNSASIGGKLYDQLIVKYFWLFYIGMFIAEHADECIPVCVRYWPVFLLVAFGFYWTQFDIASGYYLGWSVFLLGGVIGFAYSFPQLSVPKDISYGLFLYHMIVVNIFVQLGLLRNWSYAILAALIAIMLAFASTVTVGRQAARRKNASILKNTTEPSGDLHAD